MAVIVTSYGKVAARTLRYPKAPKDGNSRSNPRVLRSTAVNASLEGIERVMAGLHRMHGSRGAQTFQTIVSFSKAEFDPADPADHDRAMMLLVGIAQDDLPPGTPSAIYLQADGKTGCLHGHIVSCTTLPMDCELNGKTWRAGRKLGGDWTDIDQYRARCNATMESLGFVNELVNTKHHDIRLTKHESGISHRQRDYDKRAQEGALKDGERRPADSARVDYTERMDDTYLEDPRADSLDGLTQVLADYDSAYNLRVTKDGRISIAFQIPGRKSWTRGSTLGDFMTYDSIVEMLEQNRLRLPRRRLQPRQSETRPDKVMAAPTADEVAQAQAAVLAMANAERAQQRNDEMQSWLWDRIGRDAESRAEWLWQQYGDAQLDKADWAQLHEQMDTWKAEQDARRAALPQRIAADDAARRARLSPQERRVDQIALDLGLPHDDHVWDELMAVVGELSPHMLTDDAVTMDDWVDAHIDDVELNAVRRRAGLPEVEERPVSGYAVADHVEHLETAENRAAEPRIGADEAPEEAHDPEVTMDGSPGATSGSSSAASDMAGSAQILENEDPGSSPDGTGTRTPSGGQNAPNSDPVMATPDRQVATEPGEDRGLQSGADELELLELRYQLATEGASWTEDEVFNARVRIELMKDDIGIAGTAEPSIDEVIAEYQQRVLRRALPSQHEPEPSSPPGSSGPSPLATASVDVEKQHHETGPSSAPASSGTPSAPPGLAGVVTAADDQRWASSIESASDKARPLLVAAKRWNAASRVTMLDEGRVAEIPKGIGSVWLQTHGALLDPEHLEQLQMREERRIEKEAVRKAVLKLVANVATTPVDSPAHGHWLSRRDALQAELTERETRIAERNFAALEDDEDHQGQPTSPKGSGSGPGVAATPAKLSDPQPGG